MVPIWSTFEGQKAQSNLEPSSGFQPGTYGLGMQRTNH